MNAEILGRTVETTERLEYKIQPPQRGFSKPSLAQRPHVQPPHEYNLAIYFVTQGTIKGRHGEREQLDPGQQSGYLVVDRRAEQGYFIPQDADKLRIMDPLLQDRLESFQDPYRTREICSTGNITFYF
ncbi:hypothetical protein HYV86_02070 [Candidatus Woesearchaeota archaeon]|nr:hypothetical protein [Candidatus Woesearchaeota archaeon]